jgi:hypothetical protein
MVLALSAGVILFSSLGCGSSNSTVAPTNPAPPPQNISVEPSGMGTKATVPEPPKPPR